MISIVRTFLFAGLLVCFAFVAVFAYEAGSYAQGYSDGSAAVATDVESSSDSAIRQAMLAMHGGVVVPEWRMNLISKYSEEYQRGFIEGYTSSYSGAVLSSPRYWLRITMLSIVSIALCYGATQILLYSR